MTDDLRLPTDLELRLAAIHQIHLGERLTELTNQVKKNTKDIYLTNATICGMILLGLYGYFSLKGRLQHVEVR